MTDISRAAGISRATLYQYFNDKASVVEATAEEASRDFYQKMARAMAPGCSLQEQLSLAAVFVVEAGREIRSSSQLFDETQIGLLMTSNAATLLRDCVAFLEPFLDSAKTAGEVRKDLDTDRAAEWFARILFSLYSTPSPVVDLHDRDAVLRFVGDHVVAGFGPPPARRSTRTERRPAQMS